MSKNCNNQVNGHSKSAHNAKLEHTSESFEFTPTRKTETKILVLYTGGTIGMIPQEDGALVPVKNKFETMIRKWQDMHDEKYANAFLLSDSKYLILPDSEQSNRVLYAIEEFDPLLDSSNMTIADWKHIALCIEKNYEEYDGFLILHGTDTLAYTASALSFMLENLGKPVIITGAQIPIFGCRSDGRDNFVSALILAGNFNIPEVTVFFRNKLFRGNRVVKASTNKFSAFNSPNCSALATVGIYFDVDFKAIFRPLGINKFNVHHDFSANVGLLKLHPNMSVSIVKAILQPPIEGIVLQTYGAGNMPSNRTDILMELRRACEAGVLIINITQCQEGNVSDIYETGKILMDIGVILGGDMTCEAAFTKLSYVLSKKDWPLSHKKRMLRTNLRGEITITRQSQTVLELAEAVGQVLGQSAPSEIKELRSWLYPSLLARAIKQGDLNSLKYLHKNDCDLSIKNCDNRTALHFACSEGQTDIVRQLLEYGASVHIRDRFNRTPLLDAIQNEHLEIIKLLINCGAHLSISNDALGEALCIASSHGLIKRLEAYKTAGANLNTPDASGRTPLFHAVFHNQGCVVKYLLEQNCNPNSPDKLGFRALDVSKQLKLEHISNMLIPYEKNE